ncbi:MAG: thioredoxin family protein [Eubacteriales bacterium]|nr:thioredoxin family protein [Eubacteriales bacterium]
MLIKILGSGCKNCTKLAENTKKALMETGIDAEVIKVEDFAEIAKHGIMSTPGLIIDEKVVSSGKVLKANEIIEIFKRTVAE